MGVVMPGGAAGSDSYTKSGDDFNRRSQSMH